jgi:hypothetical protein
MLFVMVDSRGRQGGSSDISPVISSGDSSCLNGLSPTSTSNPPSATDTPSSSSGSTSPTSSADTGNVGTIAGTVAGIVIFLAVIITLSIFVLKRYMEKKRKRNPNRASLRRPVIDPGLPYSDSSTDQSPYHYHGAHLGESSQNLDSLQPVSPFVDPSNPLLAVTAHNNANPFIPVSPTSQYTAFTDPLIPSHSQSSFAIEPFTQTTSSVPTNSSQKKASIARTAQQPTRYLVHEDLEDVLPQANDNGVVELPPQYRERVEPSQASTSSDARSSQALSSAYGWTSQ